MKTVRTWQEKDMMGRSDYEQQFAESLGFTSVPDPKRGGGWCAFQKGVVHVWDCGRFWARAAVLDNRYCNHQAHVSLEDALNDRNGTAYGPDSNPRVYSLCMKVDTMSTREHLDKLLAESTSADDFALKACAEGVLVSRAQGRRIWASKPKKKEPENERVAETHP